MTAETESLVDDIIRWDDTVATDGPCDGTWGSLAEYLVGRGWSQDRQEPTDAEIGATARSILSQTEARDWDLLSEGEQRVFRGYALVVLAAARQTHHRKDQP